MNPTVNTEKHEHDFKGVEVVVPLHNYVTEGGAIIKDRIQGKDTIKLWKCKCGAKIAYDLERNKPGKESK